MKLNRNLFSSFLLGTVLLALPAVGETQYSFTTNNRAITITQYTGAGGTVTIPNTVGSLPVTTIASDAFLPSYTVTSVTIGTNVTTIGANAFADCQSLSSVCFEGKPRLMAVASSITTSPSASFYTSMAPPAGGATYDGIATAHCTTCGASLPLLAISQSGTNVILTWSTDFSAFTSQSTTNLAPSPSWSTVAPAPLVVGGLETVTNAITGTRKFIG